MQLPNLKNIVKTVYRKIIDFVIRITKTVILSSIIIWFLYSINFNFQYTTIENSINKISNAMLFNLISIFIRIFVLIFLVPKLGLNAYILGMAFAYFTLCISLYISINNSLYKKY